jgi:hypothetical protein
VALVTIKPAHTPHEKNGEHPGHFFSFVELWFWVVVSTAEPVAQSSAQHGLTVNNSTINVKIAHRNFTQQM